MMNLTPRLLRHGLISSSALAALLGWVGCSSDPSAPSVDDGPAGTFTEIYDTILSVDTDSRCNFCHSMPASQVSNGLFHTGMDRAETYAAIMATTSTSKSCSGRAIVVPGHPEQSLLALKVSQKPPCGNRMPLGGAALSKENVRLIESWISAGANDD
jgi:hypothetical protein